MFFFKKKELNWNDYGSLQRSVSNQWRVQDFPDGGHQHQTFGANLLFGKIFAKTT